MPLPILIAAAAIAGTGGSGTLAGVTGAGKMRKAKRRVRSAEDRVESAERATAVKRNVCEAAFTEFGKTKLDVMSDALLPFHEAFSRLKRVDFTIDIGAEGAPALDAVDVIAAGTLTMTTLDVVKGVAGAGLAAAVARRATTAGVAAAASAGTGAAIGGLSGDAATNATLAWLGGGPLASGGGGMALGAIMATGIAAAPALLVGGVFLHHKGRKALAKAERFESDVTVALAKHQEYQTVLAAAGRQARTGEELLSRLGRRLMPLNGWLQTVVDRETDWTKLTDDERRSIRLAATLAVAASNLVHTPVINEDGALTQAIRTACDQASVIAG